MTTKKIENLKVSPRQVLGKHTRRLRRQGLTPVHLYGPNIASRALQADTTLLRGVLVRAGTNHPVAVEIEGEGEPHIAFVRDIQFDPLTEAVLHVDFYRVDVTQRIEAEVPLLVVGEAPAVKALGGVLMLRRRTLLVEGMPLELPEAIEVAVSGLDTYDKHVRVVDLTLPTGIVALAEPEEEIARVVPPRVREEEEEAAAAAPTAEVEVVKPEHEEAEGEGEEAE